MKGCTTQNHAKYTDASYIKNSVLLAHFVSKDSPDGSGEYTFDLDDWESYIDLD